MKKSFYILLAALAGCGGENDCVSQCQNELYESCYDSQEGDSRTDGMPCDNVEASCESRCSK